MFLRVGQRLIEKGPYYTCFLAPFSWIYALCVFFRNKLYDWHFLSVTRVPSVVVSVGNIVAGGTGKTPFVHLLAKTFSHRKVAILSRGYGKTPDEAILLSRRLPHVQVLVGRDRVALAQTADAELIILDDGFQHRRLHRDFDVVLGPHSGHFLPWGFLRDSPKRIKQADFTFKDELHLVVKRIVDQKGNEIETIAGWEVGIFCGIANPQKFKKTVEALGAKVVAERYLGDHELADLSKLPKVRALVCTEKDFVKLSVTDLPIYYLEMEMEITGDQTQWQKLIEKIDQKIDNRSTYE